MNRSIEEIKSEIISAQKTGDYLREYDLAQAALQSHPQDEFFQHCSVLALSRCHAKQRALEDFYSYKLHKSENEYIRALEPRILKDLAFQALDGGQPFLDYDKEKFSTAAFTYHQEFLKTGAHYSAINAATLYLFSGNQDKAATLANSALGIAHADNGPKYFPLATQAEASLLLNRLDEARRFIAEAAEHNNKNLLTRARTHYQLKLICTFLGIDASILDPLLPETVIHYCGHIFNESRPLTESAEIELARRIDAWRRGAVPLGQRLDERHRPADSQAACVLIAADGSQIYPDRHSIAAYYLLNTGTIVLRVGSGQAPVVNSAPAIFFEETDLYDDDNQIHTTDFVSAQRNRREIQALADLAEEERAALGGDLSVPIVCVIDGPLLPWIRSDPARSEAIDQEIEFFAAQLARLRRVNAIPMGYVDRPGSAYVLRILELVELPIEGITRDTLRTGRFRQLADRDLFAGLGPNERTGLFEPNSDANDRYQQRTREESRPSGDRIAFAYVNVARPGQKAAAVARIEMPGWIASHPARLDVAQAALYANCKPTNYPYVLARAHELAVVGQAEKADLEQMLSQALLRNGLLPEISFKASNKLLTGAGRRARP